MAEMVWSGSGTVWSPPEVGDTSGDGAGCEGVIEGIRVIKLQTRGKAVSLPPWLGVGTGADPAVSIDEAASFFFPRPDSPAGIFRSIGAGKSQPAGPLLPPWSAKGDVEEGGISFGDGLSCLPPGSTSPLNRSKKSGARCSARSERGTWGTPIGSTSACASAWLPVGCQKPAIERGSCAVTGKGIADPRPFAARFFSTGYCRRP
jgi:hypothetical protein